MLALPLKILKKIASESIENCRFRQPHCRLTPLLQENAVNIAYVSAQTLNCQKLESLGYIFTADSVAVSSLKFSWWAPKTHVFWNSMKWLFKTSRSSKVVDFGTNRKRVCNFLSVINWSYLALFQRYCSFSAENSDPTTTWPEFWGVPRGTPLGPSPKLGLRGAKTIRCLCSYFRSNPTYMTTTPQRYR